MLDEAHDGVLSRRLLQHRSREYWQPHGLRGDDRRVSRFFKIARQRSFNSNAGARLSPACLSQRRDDQFEDHCTVAGHHTCSVPSREFLGQVRDHAFWQVETRQFPNPLDQSEPNAKTLVGRPVNRNGYIKVSTAIIRVEPGLPYAAQTVCREGSRKTRRRRSIGRYPALAKQIKQSVRIEYYFGQHRISDRAGDPSS